MKHLGQLIKHKGRNIVAVVETLVHFFSQQNTASQTSVPNKESYTDLSTSMSIDAMKFSKTVILHLHR